MKLYNSVGPNPAVVNMFIAEKGLDIPKVQVDLLGGENRQPGYDKVNPTQTMPALQLDDGSVLSEITVLCEYLEELHPSPPLIGVDARERAETRMWARRIDLGICENMANGFRFGEGLGLFKDRLRCIPHASADLKTTAQERLTWLDGQIAGRTWIVGDRFTLADIMLYCFLAFGAGVGQPMNADNTNIAAWFERVKARPSATAGA